MLAGFRGPIPGTIKTSRFAYLFEIVSRHQLLGLVIFVLVAMGFMIIGKILVSDFVSYYILKVSLILMTIVNGRLCVNKDKVLFP